MYFPYGFTESYSNDLNSIYRYFKHSSRAKKSFAGSLLIKSFIFFDSEDISQFISTEELSFSRR